MSRIGIDVFPMRPPLTGIGNYQFGLLSALVEVSPYKLEGFGAFGWRPLDRASLAVRGAAAAAPQSTSRHGLRGRVLNLPGARDAARMLRRAAFALRHPEGGAPDLFHAFAYLPPGRTSCPVVPVIYDMSYLRHPEMHPPARLRQMAGLAETARAAPAIHTISDFSAVEIVELLGVARSRVHVIPPAVSKSPPRHGPRSGGGDASRSHGRQLCADGRHA